MPENDSASTVTADQLNELYWSGDRTIEEIVRDLNVSRDEISSAVRPMDAATVCVECGDAMVYTNRSSRDSHVATCSGCGTEANTLLGAGAFTDGMPLEPVNGTGWRPEGHTPAWNRWREDLASVTPQRAAMVGGAAALGVMLGAAATKLLREMR